MVGTLPQKRALAVKMADYFSKKGYTGTPWEFNKDTTRPVLVHVSTIHNIFGSWSDMLTQMKRFPETAEIMKEIPVEKPAPVVKKPAKPAKKAEKEGDDAEDI